jgi:hypothetical protein
MKERWIGVGLGVGATLALGIAWTDSAQAFSLGTPVTVTNILYKTNGPKEVFDGPDTVTVVPGGTTLKSFGQIWDIGLSDRAISFSLNSPFFADVTTGVDVYRFQARGFGRPGSYSLLGAHVTPFGDFIEGRLPYVVLRGKRRFDVVFPLGFATGDFRQMTGQLGLNIKLDIRPTLEPTPEPTPVPTPAVLPGLVGLSLAVLRKQRAGNPAA